MRTLALVVALAWCGLASTPKIPEGRKVSDLRSDGQWLVRCNGDQVLVRWTDRGGLTAWKLTEAEADSAMRCCYVREDKP